MSAGRFAPSEKDPGSHSAESPLVAVIGAGPAGLMAAEILATAGRKVNVFDRMPSPARKFLMAGRGGLNLTHSEELPRFITRYAPQGCPVPTLVKQYSPETVRAWAEGLGQPTFVGTSGRVFPKALKASPLLRAWLQRLAGLGVELHLRHRWEGWTDDGELAFEAPYGARRMRAAATVLALGGASWPRLGSDGLWTDTLGQDGIPVAPLGPFNAGALVNWSKHLVDRFQGAPLKRIALACSGRIVRGEAVITRSGLEGGCVYALNDLIVHELASHSGRAEVLLDLRPDLDLHQLVKRLGSPRGRQSMTTHLRRNAGLSPAAIAVAREPTGELPQAPENLAAHIKSIRLTVNGLFPLERAISTTGGVEWQALDSALMLLKRPGVFCAGEMLNWTAPTGGYLLQGVFASAAKAAEGVLYWLDRPSEPPK